MDNVARMPAADRADLFVAAAQQRGWNVAIIEKDFWVCWTLKRLFTIPQPPAGLIFKGGTSLSKVFGAIERFSEDVDLSLNRSDLGFGAEQDPAQASSGKKRQKSLERLAESAAASIRAQWLPQLRAMFEAELKQPPGEAWRLEFDPSDPEGQTLQFTYPAGALVSSANREFSYLRPRVVLEFGARGEQWPAVAATFRPYAAEDLPSAFADPLVSVRAVAAERTFWEKATILHMWRHAPPEKPLRDRQARHYYDVVQLYEQGLGRRAMQDVGLLRAVAKHKQLFFPQPWAKYEEAIPGTLRLVPSPSRFEELRRDYERMREMIFGAAPTWDRIVSVLAEIETAVNRPAE